MICAEAKRFDATLRWIVRKLRLLLDALDERLHAVEVRLRAPVESSTFEERPSSSEDARFQRPVARCDSERPLQQFEMGSLESEQRASRGAPSTAVARRVSFAEFQARRARPHRDDALFRRTTKRPRRSAAAFDQRLRSLANDFESAWGTR